MLNNPIWSALTTCQASLAVGNELARCFPQAIGPLTGLANISPEAYSALKQLQSEQDRFVLFLEAPANPPDEWIIDLEGPLTQMILGSPQLPAADATSESQIIDLRETDVPEMLALTRLTRPGPFEEQTITMGRYIGILDSGRLVAMAGERLHLDGYTEISAVCTHPDFQGRGYAKTLMCAIADGIIQRGETPFLHAWKANTNAIRLYEKLGFKKHQGLHVAVLRLAAGIQPA